MSKFMRRMLVNAVGVPALILFLYFGGAFFSAIIAIIAILGAWEMQNLSAAHHGNIQFPLLVFFLFVTYLDLHIYSGGFGFSILITFSILLYVFEVFRGKEKPLLNVSASLFAYILLGILLASLVTLRNLPNEDLARRLIFALFFGIWITDSAAYVFGKWLGKKKILPRVSPNKTVLGTSAGLLFSFLLFFALRQFGYFPIEISFIDVLAFSFITGVLGQAGDFAESLLKREAGIKDSSRLLSEHGGILDRFDSIIVAAPVFTFYSKYYLIIQ